MSTAKDEIEHLVEKIYIAQSEKEDFKEKYHLLLKEFEEMKNDLLKEKNENAILTIKINEKFQSILEETENLKKLMKEINSEMNKVKKDVNSEIAMIKTTMDRFYKESIVYKKIEQKINEIENPLDICTREIEDLKKMVIELRCEIAHLKSFSSSSSSSSSSSDEDDDTFNNDETTSMCDAAQKGSLTGVKFWYQVDPNYINQIGEAPLVGTPLHWAASRNFVLTLKFLISKGANVNAICPGSGHTPLIVASMHGHYESVVALIKAGAAVDARDISNNTALHHAAGIDNLSIVLYLLSKGANVTIKNQHGESPFDIAKKAKAKWVPIYFREYLEINTDQDSESE